MHINIINIFFLIANLLYKLFYNKNSLKFISIIEYCESNILYVFFPIFSQLQFSKFARVLNITFLIQVIYYTYNIDLKPV